jgi:hypothetical protein
MLNALMNVRFWGQSGDWPTAAYQSRFMSTRPNWSRTRLRRPDVPGILASRVLEVLDSELSQGDGLVGGQVAHVDVRVAVFANPHEGEEVGEA